MCQSFVPIPFIVHKGSASNSRTCCGHSGSCSYSPVKSACCGIKLLNLVGLTYYSDRLPKAGDSHRSVWSWSVQSGFLGLALDL